MISRLRWHLHELDPAWPAPANFDRASAFARIKFHLDDFSGIVADLAQRLLTHLHRLTEEIDELTAELSRRIPVIAPALLAIVGCGSLTAAKILGETPALRGSARRTPTHAITALPRCRCGLRTRPGTDSPEPGTDS